MRHASFALALAGAVAIAGSAQAYVLVAGGTFATACSQSARFDADTMAALDQCTEALREPLNRHDRAGTLVNRGIVFFNRGAYTQALEDFDAAIAHDATLAEGHINRGAALIRQHDYAGAVAAISRGLELTPEAPARAYYNRGVANEELGDIRAAYHDYRRAAELAPGWDAPRTELTRFRVG
jgi:tetratricopeptide (TPR) repeat protein